jgi:nucleotidyltransferase substrate binding protein (TIGR01987 family)
MTKSIKDINFQPLIKASQFLQNGIRVAKSDLEKAGAIQAFEFCYELAWKTMKRILAHRGIDLASPREVFRAAGQEHLIDDVEIWFDFITKRNLTVHVYNLDVANEIFAFLPIFMNELNQFIQKIQAL